MDKKGHPGVVFRAAMLMWWGNLVGVNVCAAMARGHVRTLLFGGCLVRKDSECYYLCVKETSN